MGTSCRSRNNCNFELCVENKILVIKHQLMTVSNNFLYSALNNQKQTPGRRGYGTTLSFYPYIKTVQNDKRKNECNTYQILHYKKIVTVKKPTCSVTCSVSQLVVTDYNESKTGKYR